MILYALLGTLTEKKASAQQCIQNNPTKYIHVYGGLLLSVEGHGPRLQWMAETAASTEPHIYCVFSYTYVPMMKFNS